MLTNGGEIELGKLLKFMPFIELKGYALLKTTDLMILICYASEKSFVL